MTLDVTARIREKQHMTSHLPNGKLSISKQKLKWTTKSWRHVMQTNNNNNKCNSWILCKTTGTIKQCKKFAYTENSDNGKCWLHGNPEWHSFYTCEPFRTLLSCVLADIMKMCIEINVQLHRGFPEGQYKLLSFSEIAFFFVLEYTQVEWSGAISCALVGLRSLSRLSMSMLFHWFSSNPNYFNHCWAIPNGRTTRMQVLNSLKFS